MSKKSSRPSKKFSLKNRKLPLRILITAGPTREYLDPVRFLTNASSGKMGVALATQLSRRHRVTVIAGPITTPVPANVKYIPVQSAVQMWRKVRPLLSKSDIFIATAAVSDYRFKEQLPRKMKKGTREITLQLTANPDLLRNAGDLKKQGRLRNIKLVGFCLETSSVEKAALKKLRAKNLDLIVGNKPASFGTDKIKPYWLESGIKGKWLPEISKQKLSAHIQHWIEQ
jgi:phosphopantothenoylcysteine decarboxylase/phosphopantothenate--cysteine ligase